MLGASPQLPQTSASSISAPPQKKLSTSSQPLKPKQHTANQGKVVRRPQCSSPGCLTVSYFNTEGSFAGMYCAKHREPGMVDVINTRCIADGCTTQPFFNTKGSTRGLFCKSHKAPAMVEVVKVHCAQAGCETRPGFNTAGVNTGLYCSVHKHQNMVDVVNPQCKQNGCGIRATFNIVSVRRGRFCAVHAHPDMVDVHSKLCESSTCIVRASFGLAGSSNKRFCMLHRQPKMVAGKNLNRRNNTSKWGPWLVKSTRYIMSAPMQRCAMAVAMPKPDNGVTWRADKGAAPQIVSIFRQNTHMQLHVMYVAANTSFDESPVALLYTWCIYDASHDNLNLVRHEICSKVWHVAMLTCSDTELPRMPAVACDSCHNSETRINYNWTYLYVWVSATTCSCSCICMSILRPRASDLW